ncbi:Uncharacterized protein APZ42_016857 [Daphnia magna]|uniref:Uncharacterized protein n=1 Tax=Daphnia magna TaxID=35525 RepID=A0A165A6Z9_9CRUS|nr:Uncharacterized protein APZ42_016857 [Daphnia magna]
MPFLYYTRKKCSGHLKHLFVLFVSFFLVEILFKKNKKQNPAQVLLFFHRFRVMPIKTRFPFNTSRNLMTAIALKFSSIVCPSLCHQLLLVVQVLEHVRTLRPRLYRTAATKTVKDKCIA